MLRATFAEGFTLFERGCNGSLLLVGIEVEPLAH
jgi:hypothetical protein